MAGDAEIYFSNAENRSFFCIECCAKKVANTRGAASVLVIFMMLILVTLGTFAVTAANANYKFSQRSLDWNVMYYSLDAKAEEFLSSLDGKLAEAETAAFEYMRVGGYITQRQADIPEQMQTEIYNTFLKNGFKNNFGGDVFNKVYMYYADKYLGDLLDTYSGFEAYPNNNDPFIDSILTWFDIKSDDGFYGLSISVQIEPVEYMVSEVNGRMSITRSNNDQRYKIESWYEYQEPIHEEQELELWDGGL